MTKQEIRDIVTAMGAYTELTGTTWDGSNKYKTSLSGNLALSLSTTKTGGVLVIEDNNSHTLTINGTSIPINATTPTLLGYTKANGIYYVIDKDGLTIQVAGADATAPTVVTATAIDLHTIEIVFSESMGSVTTAGHSFKQNGGSINPDSVTGSGTTWQFVFSETFLSTDTLLRTYNSAAGDTTDVIGNELASYTDVAVDNDIFADSPLSFDVLDASITESPTGTFTAGAAERRMAYAAELMAGDGYVGMEIGAGIDASILGLDVDATLENWLSGGTTVAYKVLMFVAGGTIYSAYEGAVASTQVDHGSTAGISNIYIRRTGSNFKLQKSNDGVTFTDIATLGITYSGDLYAKGFISSNTNKLLSLKKSGFA